MTEDFGESLKYKLQKTTDKIKHGWNFNEYFHNRPIPSSMADKLYKKLSVQELDFKQGLLLSEYERFKFYQNHLERLKQDKEDFRVLVVASGFDGIPSRAFGEENVTMLSRDRETYFTPYRQYYGNVEKVKKTEADMYKLPFADSSYSNIVVNAVEVFNQELMNKWDRDNVGNGEDSRLKFFREMRRVTKDDGFLLLTEDHSTGFGDISPELKASIEELGWRFESREKTPVFEQITLHAVSKEN